MSTNNLYAVISVCIAACICVMFFTLSKSPSVNAIEIERTKAQGRIDAAKIESAAREAKIACIERLAKALGTEATRSWGGADSEVKRVCK